jgi:hypothetical protein
VFVSLYKCMILATADLLTSLNGNLQWLKGMTKHYDWAGQMDTLREEAQRVSDFLCIKEWQELHKRSPEGQKLPRRDSRINVGPGPRNPLHWAAALGVPDNVAHYVRNREYPVNALTEENWTAAHLAAQNGRPNVIKILATTSSSKTSTNGRHFITLRSTTDRRLRDNCLSEAPNFFLLAISGDALLSFLPLRTGAWMY